MKKSIFLIFMFLLIPLNVFATNDINIVCNKTKLKMNEETTCKINVSNLNFTVIDATGKIILGNDLQLISSTYDKNVWISLDNNFSVTDINLMRHNNDKIDSVTIATFKIKASSNATGDSSIKFNNVALGNSDYQSISLNCSPLNIRFGNNINTLDSLSVKGYDIKFSKDKTNYTIETEKDSLIIEATPTDKNASISGTGTKKISYGNNILDIVVTAENGLTKTYKINVNRKDNRSTINDLSNITLSHGNLKFNKEITEYTVNVPHSVDTIDIKYELVDKKSKAEMTGDTNLIEGENLFVIKVTAENTKTKEYKINIIRDKKVEVTPSNKISNIIIKEHQISFNPNIYEYTINTKYQQLDIEITLEDSESQYKIIGNENLKDGSIITITVTDKNGNSNIYKLTIKNKEEGININIILTCILCIAILVNVIMSVILFKKIKKYSNSN